MGLKATELRSGCFARAAEDEPMFVLLGRDRLAPWLVLAWSWLRRCQIWIGTKPAIDFVRCDEAAALAKQMRAWRNAELEMRERRAAIENFKNLNRGRAARPTSATLPQVIWSDGAPTEVVWPREAAVERSDIFREAGR